MLRTNSDVMLNRSSCNAQLTSTGCDALTVVFAKAPLPGTVKTRLIPLLGAHGAAALHRKLVTQTLSTATHAGLGPVELHGAPDTSDNFLADAARREGIALVPQQGADLGARLLHAFSEALSRHPRVIIVGTDCPVLETKHYDEACSALRQGHDAAFVPAEDGGYALIALARCDASLFAGVAWGTESVMAETRARLKALQWRWHELETLWDIDRPDDYRRWSEQVLQNENQGVA